MTTPTTEEIRIKATEIYFAANPMIENSPEDSELKEAGFWQQATDFLMRNLDDPSVAATKETVNYAEQLVNGLGYRVVPEKDCSLIQEASRLKEKLKQEKREKTKKETMTPDFTTFVHRERRGLDFTKVFPELYGSTLPRTRQVAASCGTYTRKKSRLKMKWQILGTILIIIWLGGSMIALVTAGANIPLNIAAFCSMWLSLAGALAWCYYAFRRNGSIW